MTHASPDERLAHRIVARELGWQPQMVRRFTAGLDFFVFDVSAGTSNVVVRIGRPRQSEVLRRGNKDTRGLDDLARQVAERRQELLRRHNLDGTMQQVRELLDRAVLAAETVSTPAGTWRSYRDALPSAVVPVA